MRACRSWSRWLALGVVSALGAAGCLLVTPLEDLPAPRSSDGKGGKAPVAGAGLAGAEDGGEGATGGSSGSAGNAGGGGSGGKVPTDGPCETNAECMARIAEEPARCRPSDHTCVPLLNDVCPLAYGNPEDPNAIFFGAFTTFNPSALEENSISWAHRLALEELSGNNIGGLPDGPGGKRRPLAMLLCSNLSKDVDPAMKHLVEEVEVPAVIATLRPGDLRRAFDDYNSREILYLSPVTVTQTLIAQDKSNLVWNLLGKPADLAPAYAPLLALTERFIYDERDLPADVPLRVAFVTTKEAFDSELGAAVPSLLTFNGGKTVTENGVNYKGIVLDPAAPMLDERAIEIIKFRPHVIISAANELLSGDKALLEKIETDWQDPNNPGTLAERNFRPNWILSPFNAGDLDGLQALIKGLNTGADPLTYQRFLGISIANAVDTTLQNSYATRLRTAYSDAYQDSANYYDAIYYLAYGMYAAGTEQELSGPSIAQGLTRLVSGEPFNVGPKSIASVFDELSDPRKGVELGSTLGPPGFDPKTGVRTVEGSVFCFDNKEGIHLRIDALRYDAESKQLVADEFPCFERFYYP
jgi:hypothetical protein